MNFFTQPSGWIWSPKHRGDDGKPFILYFRKSITLDDNPSRALIQVSADSRYRLYINGQSVAFGPCKGDDQVWYYDEVDVAPYLKQGDNVFAAVVLRYSLLSSQNRSVWRTQTPGFYLKGEIESEKETISVIADNEWFYTEQTNVEILPESPQMQYLWVSENATGNTELSGWNLPGYCENWQKAFAYTIVDIPLGCSPGNLHPRPIPFLYEKPMRFKEVKVIEQLNESKSDWVEFISGKEISLKKSSTYIVEIDAGELTTGFLQFEFSGGTGTKITILRSESYAYEPDKNSVVPIPIKGDRTDSKKGELYGHTDNYQVGGYGTSHKPEYYEPFWFRAFRFIQLKIQTADEPLNFISFSYRETGYPLNPQTSVTTSDETLTDVWDISLRTLRRCMHETYEDCPFYEQTQHIMDTRSQILFTYNVAADNRMAQRSIDDFHRSLRYDGLLNNSWPNMDKRVISGFSLYYIMILHDYMMYWGDKDFLRKYISTVDSILGFYDRNLDERGLVSKIGGPLFPPEPNWSFIDWTPEWYRTCGVPLATHKGPITMESLIYSYALTQASVLLDYLGRSDHAGEYRERASKINRAINDNCLSADGLYQDGPGINEFSQHCQAWAVLADVAPPNNWKTILKRSLNEKMPHCSVAMAFYLFRALEKADMYDETKFLWEPWREMVRNNLTTCQENNVEARSDCHAWGSLILYELPAVVLGVRPSKPGFEEIVVKPVPGYLDWAKGSVITPKGMIEVSWKKENGKLSVDVNAPEDVKIQQ